LTFPIAPLNPEDLDPRKAAKIMYWAGWRVIGYAKRRGRMLNTSSTGRVAQTAPPNKHVKRFLLINAVLLLVGLSKSTVYRYIKEGLFPEPVSIGNKCVAWLESEILQWMNERIKERNKKGILNA
jgi:prophage regulatory protein